MLHQLRRYCFQARFAKTYQTSEVQFRKRSNGLWPDKFIIPGKISQFIRSFSSGHADNNLTVNNLSTAYGSNVNIKSLPLEAVVKVYSDVSSPNPHLPWQMREIEHCTGSGVVIPGKRILTNAHVVADEKFTCVRKFGDHNRYPARVISVSNQSDLALLEIDSRNFWENMFPLKFGDIPHWQDPVDVVGYPMGGENICVTRGIVSRIELQPYEHGGWGHLLTVQIDAAINSGNSGGPALNSNFEIVGIAFQSLEDAENCGFIIPTPVINHFLQDVERNGPKVTGVGFLGIQCQTLENHYLRRYYGMSDTQSGVNITLETANYVQRDDIIMSIDGFPIGYDGTILFRNRERILFDYIIQGKFPGDLVSLTILRKGKEIQVQVPLSRRSSLVPHLEHNATLSYFVHAGLVFTTLTQGFLQEFGSNWESSAPRKLLHELHYGVQQFKNDEIVIVSNVLADQITIGYESLANQIVRKVNGTEVRNLKHLVQLINQNKEHQLRIDLDDNMVVAMSSDIAKERTHIIAKKYAIPCVMSPDLLQE